MCRTSHCLAPWPTDTVPRSPSPSPSASPCLNGPLAHLVNEEKTRKEDEEDMPFEFRLDGPSMVPQDARQGPIERIMISSADFNVDEGVETGPLALSAGEAEPVTSSHGPTTCDHSPTPLTKEELEGEDILKSSFICLTTSLVHQPPDSNSVSTFIPLLLSSEGDQSVLRATKRASAPGRIEKLEGIYTNRSSIDRRLSIRARQTGSLRRSLSASGSATTSNQEASRPKRTLSNRVVRAHHEQIMPINIRSRRPAHPSSTCSSPGPSPTPVMFNYEGRSLSLGNADGTHWDHHPGPVPSGPSSPSSPSDLHHRRQSLLHHSLHHDPILHHRRTISLGMDEMSDMAFESFAAMFPRPPTDADHHQIDGRSQRKGPQCPSGTLSAGLAKVSALPTRLDTSPTLPVLTTDWYSVTPLRNCPRNEEGEDFETSAAANTDIHTYSPPSPALTPSPLSFTHQTPILSAPGSPNQRDHRSFSSSGSSSSSASAQTQAINGQRLLDDDDSSLASPGGITKSDDLSITKDSQRSLPKDSSDMFTQTVSRTRGDWAFEDGAAHSVPSVHPFHHKHTPSVPSSTRTASTLSQSAQLLDSIASPPPSYVQVNNPPSTVSSRRQSRYIGASGNSSSASSLYSTSDTSSLRYGGGNHHWGLGEKPDISTVFEEESTESIGLEIDWTKQRSGQAEAILQRNLAADLRAPKDTSPRAPQGQHRAPSSDHYPAPPSSSSRYPNLHNQPSIASLDRAHSTQQNRSRRSGTISSQSESVRSGKSVHPFASAVIRSSSPPPLPSAGRATIANSRSHPNLVEAYTMSSAPAHQVTLASTENKDDEDSCPICCESLSFTFRLPGEKPHVVPECGHALHEASKSRHPLIIPCSPDSPQILLTSAQECFGVVYGPVPAPGSRRNIGVCGVCRQPMRIVEGGMPRRKGGNKLASLTGQASSSTSGRGVASSGASTADTAYPSSPPGPTDPNADDPLEALSGMTGSSSSRSLTLDTRGGQGVVVPQITIKPEFTSISRIKPQGKQQLLTAMITVAVPSAGDRGKYPARPRPLLSAAETASPQLPPSPRSAEGPPPSSAKSAPPLSSSDPFAHVIRDLQNRVVEYKSSGLETLGPLRLFDLLSVRKGALIREFHVYLFEDALICITEEKKSTIRNIFSSASSVRSAHSNGSKHGQGELKLKGRIYLRHVKKIVDSSVPGELSLTIVMVDENMDSFILTFKDRGAHETWRRTLSAIVEEARDGHSGYRPESSSKIAKLMGDGAPMPRSASGPLSAASINIMSPTSTFSGPPDSAVSSTFTSQMARAESSPGDLAYVAPLAPQHTPVDLVIILSLPAPNPNQGSALPLKTKLIKSSMAFLLALMGPKDRIALVSCEMGVNGAVRKTPFLNTTRPESRRRLENFVEQLGTGNQDDVENQVPVGPEEKMDVVTAVNVALDVVLQRKQKNPLGGMILISDTSDSIKRAQMELVTARLDAANLPVHALGYGKGHDPSPLWMISNHTNGTYTFVKEWYHLRDTLAGVVGGMMSVAVTNMKLHLNCQDNEFKILKVAGSASAIVHQGGKEVDVELKELKFGETRELLVELDLADSPSPRGSRLSGETQGSGDGHDLPHSSSNAGLADAATASRRAPSAAGSVINSSTELSPDPRGLGFETLALNEGSPGQIYDDALIDEWPVTEVDCSWHDPASCRSVAKLAHPVLLTVASLPNSANVQNMLADPILVRRRMEVLASDMITRALLIASRKNHSHAARILSETRKIIETVSEGLEKNLMTERERSGGARTRREVLFMSAVEGLINVINDLETLIEGLDESNRGMFERDARNFAAQQAVVLRSQKSWTIRTGSESRYVTPEMMYFINLSSQWTPGR